MSTFRTVVDAACCTIGKTKVLLEILNDHMKELTIHPQVPEPPTVMSTLGVVSAPMVAAQAPTVTQEEEDEDENFPLSHLGFPAGNPPTEKNQRQKRHEPTSAAPTTKAYKGKARQNQRKRKASEKAADNKAQGKTPTGKNAY
jgi:hypothetical protein